jgi:hypothetical protein
VGLYSIRNWIEMVYPQMTKPGMRALGTGGQHVADLYLPVGDDHTVDEQFHQHPALREVGTGQPGADRGAKALDPFSDSAQLQPLLSGGRQLALLSA